MTPFERRPRVADAGAGGQFEFGRASGKQLAQTGKRGDRNAHQ